MTFLETPRLLLRPFTSDNAVLINDWYYDEAYANFFRHIPRPFSNAELLNYPVTMNSDVLMIQEKRSGRTIGMALISGDKKCNRSCFFGLLIDKKFQGKIYSFETTYAVMDYCFNKLGFRKFVMETIATHDSLTRVFEKRGFIKEGTLVEEVFMNGKFVDEHRYCMLASKFNEWVLSDLEQDKVAIKG